MPLLARGVDRLVGWHTIAWLARLDRASSTVWPDWNRLNLRRDY